MLFINCQSAFGYIHQWPASAVDHSSVTSQPSTGLLSDGQLLVPTSFLRHCWQPREWQYRRRQKETEKERQKHIDSKTETQRDRGRDNNRDRHRHTETERQTESYVLWQRSKGKQIVLRVTVKPIYFAVKVLIDALSNTLQRLFRLH